MIRPWCNKLGTALLVTACSIFLNMGGCDLFGWLPHPSDIVVDPPNICPQWDVDCDQISNAVETNGANAYLGLDPQVANANPSIAHGTYSDGWIENALNLPNVGTGYSHYIGSDTVDKDDWGTLDVVIMIEAGGRDWYNDNHPPPRIGIGDLSHGDATSHQFGGQFPPHSCHENGLEVDIRYVRNDGAELPLNIAGPDSLKYDISATADLMNYLIANGDVVLIYIDTAHAYLTDSGQDILHHWPGHSDHFHVRISDPDGTGN